MVTYIKRASRRSRAFRDSRCFLGCYSDFSREMISNYRRHTRSFKVIWPFLADSIAMAAVEAAIEEVDAAMEGYVAWHFQPSAF